jgi:3-deoxy-7-phosphoheptulonate synthase
MRVYFEKPRTTIGWKGLINDPHLDGSYDINTGLRRARNLLSYLATRGIPSATELLDPIVPQYIADLISWTAIGARTTESQTHREMASGLSMPIGFKNGTDGSFSTAINAMQSASKSHHFLGVNDQGYASIVNTTGNPDGHIVLRGGSKGVNFENQHVKSISSELKEGNLPYKVMIDCSHGNSNKDYRKQSDVLKNVANQIKNGEKNILGVMLESHLKEGNQKLSNRKDLEYGTSITDACINIDTTKNLLQILYDSIL